MQGYIHTIYFSCHEIITSGASTNKHTSQDLLIKGQNDCNVIDGRCGCIVE